MEDLSERTGIPTNQLQQYEEGVKDIKNANLLTHLKICREMDCSLLEILTDKVDEDMQQEYDAVLETGLFQVILFSYDDWFNHGILKLSENPQSEINAVYCGWMMQPEQYRPFYNELQKKNICLATDPEMYSLMHVFPNIYPELACDTARIS